MADPLPLPDALKVRIGNSALASGTKVSSPHSAPASITPSGPRKLVRPPMSASTLNKTFTRRNRSPLLAHQDVQMQQVSTHAESFYLQKQAQSQTPMVFVLEDGERIEGCIEWYDCECIKVRNQSRILIYKSSIKYLYKAAE